MKRILVPTDFSDHAEYALRVAAQIARENNSEIVLLHMLELPHQASERRKTDRGFTTRHGTSEKGCRSSYPCFLQKQHAHYTLF